MDKSVLDILEWREEFCLKVILRVYDQGKKMKVGAELSVLKMCLGEFVENEFKLC